jgi:hypothetical protein
MSTHNDIGGFLNDSTADGSWMIIAHSVEVTLKIGREVF